MTAPNPTAAEQAEVSRFGMFDTEIFEEIVEHAGPPICDDSRCDKDATHMLTCSRCGRYVGIVCTPHAEAVQASVVVAEHETCGARDALRDLMRVVLL